MIKTEVNKKVIDMFKDEAGGKKIQEFAGLRAKLYSYKMADEEYKKCKGDKKNIIKNTISHEDYKDCLFTSSEHRRMTILRSHRHDIYTEKVNKIALSANDYKRFIVDDRIHTQHTGITNLHKRMMYKYIKKIMSLLL